ncbi:TldD/PmbA family protein [Clostridium folliculivorans]|uniref:Peptidase n=1 Tax=Clostridium folliculivorans TaxID=2886038 RepID=A0A9W6DDP5_9CLOT|nr:TldD/PmbA family protein [Clostridium folliculivorans]GKU27887.1 peptidase [Clostridium folliculivorans]GKU32646.1 peptidase [Clostridium folliculivorans]
MDIKQFKDVVFSFAEETGFSEYEIYYSNKENLEIRIYEGEVDGYGLSSTGGVSFRGIINGKIGYAYSESLDEAAAEIIVKKAKENAELLENEDKDFIYGEQGKYENVSTYSEDIDRLTPSEQINLALQLEKKTKEASNLIEKVAECEVDTSKSEVVIINSKGLDLKSMKTTAIAYVDAVARDVNGMQNGMAIKVRTSIGELNLDEVSEEAANDAISKIGSKSIKSGKYKVLISNYMMATILGTFQGVFNADNAQKGLSLLRGKEGATIASDIVTIIDNPILEGSPYSTPFDDEGVPTYKKSIVDKGKFITLLHNLKTSNKDNVKTTGNASKSSFSSPVTISATNLYIEKGEKTFSSLVSLVGDGLYITNLQGMHSGANAITGDFSLAANGRLIRDGKIEEAVDQITVAGNFFDLLKNIEEVGSDFDFYYSNTASPSVVVGELSIAGL